MPSSRFWHLVCIFLIPLDTAEGQEKANPLSLQSRGGGQGESILNCFFFFFNNNINPFMKVEPSWPNYLWKVTLPNALGIKFGRAKAMSVDYSCLPLRFLEFVKLCQIHSCNFWLCKSTGYFQFGAKWRQVNMRPCQYHFSDQLKSLIEGKG